MKSMRTYSAKPTDVTRRWYLIDASDAPLGHVAVKIAKLLNGKDKPIFTRHIDCGDYVVVINADNLVVTGDKGEKKIYYRHSQYPGSLKSATLNEKMAVDSRKVILLAVKGMLPKNKLMADRLKRLKIYKTDVHDNIAQKPEKVSVK